MRLREKVSLFRTYRNIEFRYRYYLVDGRVLDEYQTGNYGDPAEYIDADYLNATEEITKIFTDDGYPNLEMARGLLHIHDRKKGTHVIPLRKVVSIQPYTTTRRIWRKADLLSASRNYAIGKESEK